ncbi:hypothetical protein A3860_36640 [Niastella vici]|uniref:Uncharacterized protein n=1 Tax=Niastella vici TaxID=1703345 RepID=A0A1V9FMV4_9BACT|nr:hypothetical protein A3860_36640 [Niastella vici]
MVLNLCPKLNEFAFLFEVQNKIKSTITDGSFVVGVNGPEPPTHPNVSRDALSQPSQTPGNKKRHPNIRDLFPGGKLPTNCSTI